MPSKIKISRKASQLQQSHKFFSQAFFHARKPPKLNPFLAELRILFQKPGYSLWSRGVRWALVATLAFGAMDFGIGASATTTGWLLPVLWTRIFSILFLTLIPLWKRRKQAVHADASAQRSVRTNIAGLTLSRFTAMTGMYKPFSPIAAGLLLAIIAGIVENAAVLTFSFDTRIATTGITSAIASSYALVVMIFGMVVYNERLKKNQFVGIGMFTVGLILLTL